jgi:aminoglycoside 3-N-acetyltransferase
MKNKLVEDLKTLGVKPVDSLLVHSSLKSLGPLNKPAETLWAALLEVLGPQGTLLIPTLSYKFVTHQNPRFDVSTTPSCVGGLTEYFRSFPGVKRSLHPTHSVCAFGAVADWFVGEHYLDNTPVGPHSPFRKLRDRGGKILMLGCGLRPDTSFHGIEELSEPPYLFGETVEYTLIDRDGQESRKKYRTHGFKGYDQRYDRALDVLDEADYSHGKILEADCYLIDSYALWEKVDRKMREDPFYFVDKEDSL